MILQKEVEYIISSSKAKEVVWIKKFIAELGTISSNVDPMELNCDNDGGITQDKEPRSHKEFKKILRCFHLIQEIIDKRDVKLCRMPTLDKVIGPLTKPLTRLKHDDHTRSMGLGICLIGSSASGKLLV